MRNLTLSLIPSADDLILLPQRAAEQVKQFAYYYGLDDIFGRIKGSGAFIAENTGNRSNVSATLTRGARETMAAALSSAGIAKAAMAASPGPGVGAAATGGINSFSQGLGDGGFGRFVAAMLEGWRNLGGLLPYVMSKWAFMTIVMVRIQGL